MEVHLKIQLINPLKDNDNSEKKYCDSKIIQFNEMQFQRTKRFAKKCENFSSHLRKMCWEKSVIAALMN